MKHITEDYVSFEVAKLLKEKGFDGECQGYYEVPTKLSSQKDVRKQLNVLPKNWNEYNKECVVCEYISIPTLQMALKWLREVHKWSIQVFPVFDNLKWCYDIYELKIQKYQSRPELLSNMDYDTYEQAVEAALLYTLKNLI